MLKKVIDLIEKRTAYLIERKRELICVRKPCGRELGQNQRIEGELDALEMVYYWIIAEELDELQQFFNNAQGIECVQIIVAYLRQGNLKDAQQVAHNEGDKLVQYSGIKQLLIDHNILILPKPFVNNEVEIISHV